MYLGIAYVKLFIKRYEGKGFKWLYGLKLGGVEGILCHCVSEKYTFYSEQFAFRELGSVLKEESTCRKIGFVLSFL